jgi:hypothetical protein
MLVCDMRHRAPSPKKESPVKLALRSKVRRQLLLLWTALGFFVGMLGLAVWLVFWAPNSFYSKIVAGIAGLAIAIAQDPLLRLWRQKQFTNKLMNLDDEHKAIKYLESFINAKAKT